MMDFKKIKPILKNFLMTAIVATAPVSLYATKCGILLKNFFSSGV
jgi:hypothetical protein